jgi:phosphoglycolate phosphatase-like HAD superfamily hydrolase
MPATPISCAARHHEHCRIDVHAFRRARVAPPLAEKKESEHMSDRSPLFACMGLSVWVAVAFPAVAEDLPSWKDGASKAAIVDFVARVTRKGGTDYVDPSRRIAVFDNDGTLWSEQPVYFQIAFAIDTTKALAPQHPDWNSRQPFKAAIEGDVKTLSAAGEQQLVELIAASHSGMTTEAFAGTVGSWLKHARHPRFKRKYSQLVYQPMIEVLNLLRANGFKTYIVSGGGAGFMRVFAEEAYGIPPEQVIGSSGATKFVIDPRGRPVLVKEPRVEFIDDGPGKPSAINRVIGRRPIFAFGNSDGDLPMLQWTAAGEGARFVGIVHHTDDEREYAYDRDSHVGRLDKALDEATQRRWTIVDMRREWGTVFPPAP